MIKKTFGGTATFAWSETLATRNKSAYKNKNIFNKDLPSELHKPVIKRFKKRKLRLPFIDNIWGADLANMQLISKFNKEICFCYVLLVFSVYTHGLFLWKIKKGITITNDFQNILNESNRKPNKIWVEKGSEFYYRSIKSWLDKKWHRNVFNT